MLSNNYSQAVQRLRDLLREIDNLFQNNSTMSYFKPQTERPNWQDGTVGVTTIRVWWTLWLKKKPVNYSFTARIIEPSNKIYLYGYCDSRGKRTAMARIVDSYARHLKELGYDVEVTISWLLQ